jgi:predicted phosphatase
MSTDMTTEYQVVLEIAHSSKVHVIAEYPTKEKALDGYMKLVKENKDSPITPKGKYTIRKKPA